MQSTNAERLFGDMDEDLTMMASLLKALKVEHRIVFDGKKSDAVVSGMLYGCRIEAKSKSNEWHQIESLPELVQWLGQKG